MVQFLLRYTSRLLLFSLADFHFFFHLIPVMLLRKQDSKPCKANSLLQIKCCFKRGLVICHSKVYLMSMINASV